MFDFNYIKNPLHYSTCEINISAAADSLQMETGNVARFKNKI